MNSRVAVRHISGSGMNHSNHTVSQTPLYNSSVMSQIYRYMATMCQIFNYVSDPPTCAHCTETLCGAGAMEAA